MLLRLLQMEPLLFMIVLLLKVALLLLETHAGKCCCFIAVVMSAGMSFVSGGVAAVIAFHVLAGGADTINAVVVKGGADVNTFFCSRR